MGVRTSNWAAERVGVVIRDQYSVISGQWVKGRRWTAGVWKSEVRNPMTERKPTRRRKAYGGQESEGEGKILTGGNGVGQSKGDG